MRKVLLGLVCLFPAFPALAQQQPRSPNVILYIADGLRAGMVNVRSTPAMAALMQRGVRFANPHSLFPTVTTANASAMATGHYLGDTGDFSNNLYVGFPVLGARQVATVENNDVLGELDKHYRGNYLNEETVLNLARDAGYSTAAIGKLGPTLIFDHTERSGTKTVIVDDMTGHKSGIPLSDAVKQRLAKAQLPTEAPPSKVVNKDQQLWLADVAIKAVLPMFKERGKPFVLVFWSRDPDVTQHDQKDSLERLVPGINGPSSLAAIRNADDTLARLLAALKEQGLEGTTDVIVTADHGFSTISKESATSYAATQTYPDVTSGQLPPGFVAIDLAHDLGLKLQGGGLLADDAEHPKAIVVASGGSDLIYLLDNDKALAARIVTALAREDYASGLFVDDTLGRIPGTLPLSAIGLQGSAVVPRPAIVVNFRSFSTGCPDPTTCGVEIADTGLKQGQGIHGNFSRADTRNAMGAAGPSFREKFESTAPASNADLGKTIAHLMGLKAQDKGKLVGRVLTEALPNGGTMPLVQSTVLRSEPDALGNVTVLVTKRADQAVYFDAAGYPGRTLGLPR
ncbi:MAG: alkaline phosphatase family protein [Rhodospirillaceae bacterium]